MSHDFYRGRRLRRTPFLRDLVRETELRPTDLIQPYFVTECGGQDCVEPIEPMPGQNRYGLKALVKRVEEAASLGLRGVLLFGIPRKKDSEGSQAYSAKGVVQQAVTRLKNRFPDLVVITDVCLCEYTDHGHCGIVKKGEVVNDATLELLAETAVSHAKAGADMVAPSDMMDGRVAFLRSALDQEGFGGTGILSYAVKHASAFYGPFREAAGSAPQFGDRRSYQMDSANRREALREAWADEAEGADMLMVKPAGPCLDLIRDVREAQGLPVTAYQVSGEYAMLKAAAMNGWLDEERAVLESLTAIKRAGAEIILSYFTEDVLKGMSPRA